MTKIYEYSIQDNKGNNTSLEEYKDQVLLIVNVASRCGFTPQYKGLQSLYEKYQEKGFSVLAFPCNQFGSQEPGADEEIQKFCDMNYSITFPIFSKINVNGAQESALFTHLKKEAPGIMGSKAVKWNFTKFLIDKNGNVLKRFAPKVKPADIDQEIDRLLSSN